MTRPGRLALALALTDGIGSKTVARIMLRNSLLRRSPDEFLSMGAEVLIEEYRLRRAQAETWTRNKKNMLSKALALDERLAAANILVLSPTESGYPQSIEELVADPPGLLFVHGNTKLLAKPTFCVLSSRKSSLAQLDEIEKRVEEGVMSRQILVAGHDTPEYQRAAVVPLRWGAPRVLVLDSGMFDTLGENLSEEPFRAARLWRYQFDASTDLVVSPLNPIAHSHRGANQQRDWLVAGLSQRLDFVRVSPGGNMEQIANAARQAGRSVTIGSG